MKVVSLKMPDDLYEYVSTIPGTCFSQKLFEIIREHRDNNFSSVLSKHIEVCNVSYSELLASVENIKHKIESSHSSYLDFLVLCDVFANGCPADVE